VTILPS